MATVAFIFLVIVHLIVHTYAPAVEVKPVAVTGSKDKILNANSGPKPVPKNGSTPATHPAISPAMPGNLSETAKIFYKKYASLLTPGVSINDFEVQKHLSTGEDGNVYIVRRIKDNAKFALKEIDLTAEAKFVRPAKEKFIELAEQVDIQVTATKDKRTHINNVIAVFLDENKICIVLELMKDDVNHSILETNPRVKLTEKEFCGMTKGMIEDLAYLEAKGITHRDLDTCNLFVNENNEIVIGDFQRATKQKEFSCIYHAWPKYAPPEWERTDNIKCTIKVDVWAIGVFLEKIKEQITDASDAFVKLLSPDAIFSEDPTRRPSFSKILSSPLFQQC